MINTNKRACLNATLPPRARESPLWSCGCSQHPWQWAAMSVRIEVRRRRPSSPPPLVVPTNSNRVSKTSSILGPTPSTHLRSVLTLKLEPPRPDVAPGVAWLLVRRDRTVEPPSCLLDLPLRPEKAGDAAEYPRILPGLPERVCRACLPRRPRFRPNRH